MLQEDPFDNWMENIYIGGGPECQQGDSLKGSGNN